MQGGLLKPAPQTRPSMKNLRSILAAPAACGALLLGMMAESATRITPTDVAPYHQRAREALKSLPMQIGSWSGAGSSWSQGDADNYQNVEVGAESGGPVPKQAIQLLHPNFIGAWRFTDNAAPAMFSRQASLLIDQCADAGDMAGHWPPNCYVNNGEEMVSQQDRDWTVGDLVITGREYRFVKTTATETTRTAVYDFLIVPGRGIIRDMDGVWRAAEDYQRRYYGAAQFQLLMNADLPQQERDEIFTTLMQPCVPVIRTLMSGGSQ